MKARSSLAATALIAGVLTSCGGSSLAPTDTKDPDAGKARDGGDDVILCDGSSDTRFRYEVGGGGPGSEGEIVMTENGFSVLVIDGKCNFWSYGSAWELGVRKGQLSHDQETQLTGDLRLGEWKNWAGSWATGACDGPTQLFQFADSKISLLGGCDTAGTPPFDALALSKVFNDDFDAIEASAPEVNGGVHIVVYAYDPIEIATYPPPAWPLGLDPHSIAMTREAATNLQRGQSTLLPSADDGAKLRAFRDTFLAGTYGGQWYGQELSAVGSDGTRYGIWFRDIMPSEETSGLIHLF